MAAPSIVAWSETTYATRTNTSIAVPSGLKAGSLVLVYAYIQGTRIAITPPTGFTEVAWSTTPSVGTLHMRAFWKLTTAADTGTYVFTHASASTRMWAYEVDNASGVETANSVATSATATTSTPAVSLTTTGADRLLVHWSVVNGSSGNNLLTASPGFSEWWDAGGWYMATKEQAVAGASGAVSATGSPTSSIASLLAVIPKSSTYVNDTFTGTNGTVPANWTVSSGTGVINNNRFRLTPPSVQLQVARAVRSSPTATGDLDMTCSVQFMTDPSIAQYTAFYLHHSGTWTGAAGADVWQPTAGYMLMLSPPASLQYSIQRYSGSVAETIYQGTDLAIRYTGVARIRFQAFRSTGVVRFRYWHDVDPEPVTWHYSYTDPNPLPAGRVALAAVNGGGTSGNTPKPVEFDNIVIGDETLPTPPGRVIERWDGTALVRQRIERWSGSGLTVRKVES